MLSLSTKPYPISESEDQQHLQAATASMAINASKCRARVECMEATFLAFPGHFSEKKFGGLRVHSIYREPPISMHDA
jgi:hypothetical protein